MEYCNKCGHHSQEGSYFCSECGTLLKKTREESVETDTSSPTPKNLMSKPKKRMIIVAAAIILLLFIGHQLFNFIFSKDRLIENFEKALIEDDGKKIANLLSTNDKKMKIDENSVKGFMTYFQENPDQISDVVSLLKQQAKTMDKSDEEKSDIDSLAEGFYEMNMVYLEPNGKFLFYDKYKITIPAVYLEVGTNYKDTHIYIDGKEVGKANQPKFNGTFGPFLPGYHTVKASLKTDHVELKHEEELFLSGAVNKDSISIHLDADEVTFALQNEGDPNSSVKLFINGKDTEINLLDNSTFGPVLLDGSMTWHVEADLPWGTVKTKEQPIEDDYINVSFINSELSDTLMDTVHQYLKQFTSAYTSIDTSGMISATDKVKEWIISEAKLEKENNIALKIQYLSSQFDKDSISLDYDDGKWTANINAKNLYNRDEFYVGDKSQLSEETVKQGYDLIYDEKSEKWLVDNIDYLWFFSDKNIKELKVENPKTYTSVWAK